MIPEGSRPSGRTGISQTNKTTELTPHMAANITPLGQRVLVKRITDAEEKTQGGIIIPDAHKEKPQEALVVAVGIGKDEDGKDLTFTVKKGDKVLISKYGGTEVKLNGEEHLILNENDILGILG